MKKIKDIGFTIEELRETELELKEAIHEAAEELGIQETKEYNRVRRIVNNKFEFAKDIVQAQNYLSENIFIEVEK